MSAVLRIRDLHVSYHGTRSRVQAVRGIDLEVGGGETVALVGESGSGKSTTAQAVIRLLPPAATVTAGSVYIDGTDILRLREPAMRRLRGGTVGFVPQDPGTALNPLERIGWQVSQVLQLHGIAHGRRARQRAVELLAEVALPDPERVAVSLPAALSGGMRQRVLIAMALAAQPRLVIADEPTSALDVTVQRHVLDILQSRVREHGAAMLLVTHDLGVAADRADRIVVMSHGTVVEQGSARTLLRQPRHPYTRELIASAPSLTAHVAASAPFPVEGVEPHRAPSGSRATLLHTRGLTKDFRARTARGDMATVRALDGVSIDIPEGTTLGIVGESGSGKTTLARTIARLEQADSGTIHFDGRDIGHLQGEPQRQLRRNLQVVYQNPYSSLQPRFTVERIVTEPLRHFRVGDRRTRRHRAAALLEQVALAPSLLTRRPGELSGGQRQRVAIARALALSPRLLILDEPVSALDVTVQARILNLLTALQREHGLTFLFISHDLAVIRQIAHQVVVMRHGAVVEVGPAEQLLRHPRHPYTRQLLDAVPGGAFVFPPSPAHAIEGVLT